MKKLLTIALLILTVSSFAQRLSGYQKKRITQNIIERSEMLSNTQNITIDLLLEYSEYCRNDSIVWCALPKGFKSTYIKVEGKLEISHVDFRDPTLKGFIKWMGDKQWVTKQKKDILHPLKSSEIVKIFRIAEIEKHSNEYYYLIPIDKSTYGKVKVDREWMHKYDPHLSGYYVRLKSGAEFFLSK